MMRKFLGFILLLFLASCLDETRVDPATPSTFVRYINGGHDDFAMGMEKTDGGYIILANTTSSDTTETNPPVIRPVDKIKLVKVNAYGSVLWTRVLPAGMPDSVAGYHGNGIYASSQGYIISGEVIYTGAENKSQLLIMETDELGKGATYDVVNLPVATVALAPGDSVTGDVSGIAITKVAEDDVADKGFLILSKVTGMPIDPQNNKRSDMIFAVLDLATSPPDIRWNRSYSTNAYTLVNKIFVENLSSDVIFAGTVNQDDKTDPRLIKAPLDSETPTWVGIGDQDRSESANGICKTPNGFAMIGSTDVAGKADRDIYFARYGNSGGNALTTRNYPVFFPGTEEDVEKNEEGNSVCTTSDNGFIILGTIVTTITGDKVLGRGETDYYLMKVNAFGDVEWTSAFGSKREDIGVSVTQADDKGYLILGRTRLANLWTITLIKTNGLGKIE